MGEGKAGDNSSIVQTGVGEGPLGGRKLAFFPCSEAGAGPGPAREAGRGLQRNRCRVH